MYLCYTYLALIIIFFCIIVIIYQFLIFFLFLLSLLLVLLFAVIYIVEIKALTLELSYLSYKDRQFQMPILTRSSVQIGQSPGRVTSPGQNLNNFPQRLYITQQGKAVIVDSADVRLYQSLMPMGIIKSQGFRVSRLTSRRCMAFVRYF